MVLSAKIVSWLTLLQFNHTMSILFYGLAINLFRKYKHWCMHGCCQLKISWWYSIAKFVTCQNLSTCPFIHYTNTHTKVRKANRQGYYEAAKKGSECVMCFSILGIIFHVFAILAVITTFLLLHFLGGYFIVQWCVCACAFCVYMCNLQIPTLHVATAAYKWDNICK